MTYRILKWLMDMGFALSVLLFFWWLLVISAVLIRITSPGPVIFAQPRVGRHGKTFTCYKFRTMRVGSKQAATHEMGADAITSMGHFMRRTKIDELPQIVNIMRGEMSLIGPRPCLTSQQDLIDWRTQLGVLAVLPGITGLAQINGVDMSDPEKLARLDAVYVAQKNIWLDIKILIATLRGRGLQDYVRTGDTPG